MPEPRWLARRRFWAAALLSLVALGLGVVRAGTPPEAYAVVLGVAQDGGVPQIACTQPLCVHARADCRLALHVAALGLADDTTGDRFLIDATPDLPAQAARLTEGRPRPHGRPVDGILLTHAHVGHYTGLMHLGREALGADHVPVYATPRMAAFLRANGPWSQLVSLGQIDLHEIQPDKPFALGRFQVTAMTVPHRDEFSDTVGYRVQGPGRALLYVPDVDRWEKWDRKIETEVSRVDAALLDGTFESADELPGRPISEVPHPLVPDTANRLSDFASRVTFIHLNHTNRLLWDEDARGALVRRGFHVAEEGQRLPL